MRRDGGIVGRPGLVRGSVTAEDVVGPVIPGPEYGLLAGQTWRSDLASDRVRDFTGDNASTSGTIPSDLYTSEAYRGGIFPLRRVFNIEAADTVDTAIDLLDINLASGTPRALTLHGVQLSQGSWHSPDMAGDGTELSFAAYISRPATPTAVVPIVHTASVDPFDRGQFAPGVIPRDIVIPLVPTAKGAVPVSPSDVGKVRLRVASSRLVPPVSLAISGISCFSTDAGPDMAMARLPAELPRGFFDAPYRLIPWHVGREAFVLVLGMEWAAYYDRTGPMPVFRQGGPDLWTFTERQLRELTWTPFGSSILLCHHDFPSPLEVHYPQGGATPMQVDYLRLTNVPEAPQDAQDRARRTTFIGQELLELSAPRDLRAETVGETIVLRWLASGASRYRVRWALGQTAPQTWVNNVFTISTGHIITGITRGSHYIIQISALPEEDTTAGESAAAELVYQTRFEPPAAPTGVLADTAITADGALTLTYNAVSGADGYEVEWGVAGSDEWTNLDTTTVARAANTVGTVGTIYTFRVRAYEGDGDARAYSDWVLSNNVRAERVLGAIGGLHGVAPTATRITRGGAGYNYFLGWEAVEYATGYEVQSSETADADGVLRAPIDSTPVSFTNYERDLRDTSPRYLRVRATRGSLVGPWTPTWRFINRATIPFPTEQRAPVLPTGLAYAAATKTLSWNIISGATYEVRFRLDTATRWGPTQEAPSAAFVAEFLSSGMEYVATVRSVSLQGRRSGWATLTFTA